MQTRLTVLRLVYGIQTRIKSHLNDETLLVIDSPKLAAHFARKMNRMWRGAELGITAHMHRKLERQRA